MTIKTTGAEFKRFYADSEFWPEGGPVETISHAEWLRRTQPRYPTHSQYWRL